VNQLPHDFNVQVFVGLTVTQICVNANQLKLHFDNEILLVVENAVCWTRPASAGLPGLRITVPEFDPTILTVIQQRVASAQARSDCSLVFVFESGDMLEIPTDVPMYESYAIYHGDRQIFV
jgi:hypothetical protein